MRRADPPDPHSVREAARLAELVVAEDPASAEARAASAGKHFERARKGKTRSIAATTRDAPRTYLVEGPTRSPVLNAFLRELGGEHLVEPGTVVIGEHLLAPRLVELGRRRLAPMMLARGSVGAALYLLARLPPITNENAARFFLRRAAGEDGALGEIASDYEAHRARAGDPERDDRVGHAMMAAFAGRLLAFAEHLVGGEVRADVRFDLEELVSTERAVTRRRSVKSPAAAPVSAPAPRVASAAGAASAGSGSAPSGRTSGPRVETPRRRSPTR